MVARSGHYGCTILMSYIGVNNAVSQYPLSFNMCICFIWSLTCVFHMLCTHTPEINDTSTFYWCIASKLKVPLFFYGMNKTFLWVELSLFNRSYSGGITTTKSLPGIGGTTIQDVGPLQPMGSLASTSWAMSFYFKFRAIYFWLLNEYQWWDQAKIYHIIRQLSYRFICEIMTWSDDKTKLIYKNISTSLRLRALKP